MIEQLITDKAGKESLSLCPAVKRNEFWWFQNIISVAAAAAAAKLLQSWPTLCDPIDGSPSGSPIPGILQARTLEWVAISFSNAWKWKVKVKSLSRVRPLVTPWTAAYQGPLSVGFSRQEYWSGVPLPSPLSLLQWAIITTSGFIKLWLMCHFFPWELNGLQKDMKGANFILKTLKRTVIQLLFIGWRERKQNI